MTHIELISLLNRHKRVINQAYLGEIPTQIDKELFDAEIFIRINSRVILNESYIQFINAILKRVEYGIIFGDYQEELKQLVEYKSHFLQTKDRVYLTRIYKGIENIYLKIKRRDSDINTLVLKIIHENRLNLEVIVKDATDILSRIEELYSASHQTYNILSKDIKGLDYEIDSLILDVKLDIQIYSENLHKYIVKLSNFIRRSRRKREQNNKISSIAQRILLGDIDELEAFLRSDTKMFHHTIGVIKREKVKTSPAPKDIDSKNFQKLAEELFSFTPIKANKTPRIVYKKTQKNNKKILNYKKLLTDIRTTKPEDIFEFIFLHDEIEKFDESDRLGEAFKTFLVIILEEKNNTKIQDSFNKYKTRRVSWI